MRSSIATPPPSSARSSGQSIVQVKPTTSGKFYISIFDEKMPTMYDNERVAFTEGTKLLNYKRELLTQCQKQFNSERDLARFRKEVDWASITGWLVGLWVGGAARLVGLVV